ncbi:MAG TPA: LytTR family DNA-binding domain-containing protein [Gemmatimonadaceae bacterium]
MAIRAVIADDEPLSRRLVHQLLERHRDVEIVAQCADGAAVEDAIASLAPDVLFLDVKMPVQSGLSVARRRDGRSGPLVVFVTAFDEYALPAFETEAVDYLKKPLGEARFDAALERVRERLRLRRLDEAGTEPAQARARRQYRDHFVARIGYREVILPVADVEYIEADGAYAAVTVAAKRYLLRVSLDQLERELDPTLFTRVHRSYIVRLACVREVRHGSGLELVLDSGAVVPVSRRRRARLGALLKPGASPRPSPPGPRR